MVLQELMPQIENLSREDKTEIFNYLLKDLGAESDYLMGCIHNPEIAGEAAHQLMELLKQGRITEEELKAMDEAEAKVLELLEKDPIPERGYGIAGVEAGIKMMEYLEQREKAKV